MRKYAKPIIGICFFSTVFSGLIFAQTSAKVSSDNITRLYGPTGRWLYTAAVALKGNATYSRAAYWLNWAGPGSVTWQLEADEGAYELLICYASRMESLPMEVSGPGWSFTISLQRTEGDLPDKPWSFNFERVATGKTIHLMRGAGTLTVRTSAAIPQDGFVLRSVQLVPVKAKKRLAAEAARAKASRASTDWMAKAGYGLMFHWNDGAAPRHGPRKPYKDAVRDFNVEAFADMVAETGAGWVIFTSNHGTPHCPAPIEAWEKLFPGQTTERDLIGEMADALNQRGIELMLYFASHVLGRLGKVDRQQYMDAHKAVFRAFGERYGERLAGYWLDGWHQTYETYPDISPAELSEYVKIGNPNRLVAYNFWIYPVETEWQEYWAGEANGLRPPRARYMGRGPAPGLQQHSAWITDAPWGHAKLDTEMEPPRFTDEQVIEYVKACMKTGAAVSFNLGIFQDGTIGAATMKQMQALRKAIRGK